MLLSNVRVPSTGCRLSVKGCIRPLFVGLTTDFDLSEEIVHIPSRQYPDGSVSPQLDLHISIETMTSDAFFGYGRSFAGDAGLLRYRRWSAVEPSCEVSTSKPIFP
jgi:hypothetical protein